MKLRVLSLINIFIIIALLIPLEASAQQQSDLVADTPAIIYSQPSPIHLYVGETKTISIWVEDAVNVYSYYVRMYFDPSMVQILDADPNLPGVQVQDGDFFYRPQSITTANWVANPSGVMTYVNSFIDPTVSISGSGRLLSFDLQAIAAGTSTINLTQSYLISPQGDLLPVSVLNPQIYIDPPLKLYLPIVVGGGD
jgi:hypothetical protein